MMMSGPLPTFAATAAFGRTSSQPSASIRTSMPVACVNFLVFSAHLSSSPCTKRFQRRTRSFASFSGVTLNCCAAASIGNKVEPLPSAVPAATPAVAFRKSRRLNSLIRSSYGFHGSTCSPAPAGMSCGESRSTGRVEQMRARKIGLQTDPVAWTTTDAVAHQRRKLLPVEAAIELRVGARRFDDDDVRRKTDPIGKQTVLGTHSIEHVLSIVRARTVRQRQRDAGGKLDLCNA